MSLPTLALAGLLALVPMRGAEAVEAPSIEYIDPARPTGNDTPERIAQIAFPLILRIGLMEKQEKVTVTCRRPFELKHGGSSEQSPAWRRWTFRVKSFQPAEILYGIATRTLDWEHRQEADQEAALWRERGHTGAHVESAGSRMLQGDRVVHDNRRHYVVVSTQTSEEAAREASRALEQQGARPFVVEKLVREPQGLIEARSSSGQTLLSRTPFEIANDDRIHVSDVEFGVGQPWHGREDRDYAGSILVMLDRWGRLVAINRVEMEKYLRGVVPCEIDPDAPLEAHRTQAVSARGETLSGYGVRHPADPYDFFSDVRDQVYGGITKETALGNESVVSTRGRVLKAGDEIVETVYSASCGGHTEDNDVVWSSPPDPQLRAVPDGPAGSLPSPVGPEDLEDFVRTSPAAFCRIPTGPQASKWRWKKTLSAAEVDDLAARADLGIGKVLDLVPLERGRSGRLRSLLVVGETGELRIEKELPIRKLLGGLRSALFVIDRGAAEDGRPSSYLLHGAGWGHGVGMCQMGAREMARRGLDHVAILTHYFSGSELVELYE